MVLLGMGEFYGVYGLALLLSSNDVIRHASQSTSGQGLNLMKYNGNVKNLQFSLKFPCAFETVKKVKHNESIVLGMTLNRNHSLVINVCILYIDLIADLYGNVEFDFGTDRSLTEATFDGP